MPDFFTRYTRDELYQLLANEQKNLARAVEFGAPEGYVVELRQMLANIEASLSNRENGLRPDGSATPE